MPKTPTPPRGELFADPAAAVVYAAIQALDTGAQHQVLDALRERLATAGHAGESGPEVRERRAIGALREAAQMLGHSPSVAEFESLRAAHREFGWPPDATIRRTIGAGSWNTALGRARLDAIPDGDALVVELGPQFTAQEALDAVRACAAPLGRIPSLGEYLAWARGPEQIRTHPRLPRSQGPFDRLFGGWQRAVATLQEQDPDNSPDPSLIRKTGGRRWTDDELIGFLQEAARRLGRSPATTDIAHLREQMIGEARAAGREPLVPSYPALRRLGATWEQVLVAAGLAPRGGRHERSNPCTRPSARRFPDKEITRTLVEAYAAVGDPFTGPAFRRWRTEALAALAAQGDPYARIPGYEVIVARTEGWDNARRIARGDGS